VKQFLLDTHVALWALAAPERLDEALQRELADPRNVAAVSAAVVWEVEIKRALGKLAAPDGFAAECVRLGFDELPISFEHAERAGRLPMVHADPFDRMMIAQAQHEHLTIVTADPAFAGYEVEVRWVEKG